MRTYKKSIKWMLFIFALSLILLIAIEFKWDSIFIEEYYFLSGHRSFIIGLLASLLTGASIVIVTSIISYRSKKRELILAFIVRTNDFLNFCWDVSIFIKETIKKTSLDEIDNLSENKRFIKDLQMIEKDYSNVMVILKEQKAFFLYNKRPDSIINKILNSTDKLNRDTTALQNFFMEKGKSINAQLLGILESCYNDKWIIDLYANIEELRDYIKEKNNFTICGFLKKKIEAYKTKKRTHKINKNMTSNEVIVKKEENQKQPQQKISENNDIVNTPKIETKKESKTNKYSFLAIGICMILLPIIIIINDDYFLSEFTTTQKEWITIILAGIIAIGLIILAENFNMFIENIKKKETIEFICGVSFCFIGIVLKNTFMIEELNLHKSIYSNTFTIVLIGLGMFLLIRFCIYLLNEWIKNDFVIKSEKTNNLFSTITKVTAVLSALGIWKLIELLLENK